MLTTSVGMTVSPPARRLFLPMVPSLYPDPPFTPRGNTTQRHHTRMDPVQQASARRKGGLAGIGDALPTSGDRHADEAEGPPATASTGGVSPSTSQPSRIAIG